MPEVPLCTECRRPIYFDDEHYVVLNKGRVPDSEWDYTHVACFPDEAEQPETVVQK